MRFFQNRLVILIFRWALAAVFIYAGAMKLGSPQSFGDSIASFAILPNNLINVISLGLPPFEIIAGFAIVFGIQRRPAILAFIVLTAVFMLALGSAIIRGISVDCGCFGSGKPSSLGTWISFGRDIPILAVSIYLYLFDYNGLESGAKKVGIREEIAA